MYVCLCSKDSPVMFKASQTSRTVLFLKSLFLYYFDLIFHIILFSSIKSLSLDVTVSVQINSAMISSCSNIGHVLLFTMLLPEILLLLIGYLILSLISYH